MKVLITGGNGYIASSIRKSLNKKYDITSISRDDFDLRNQRLTTKWFMDKHYDVVIHTAIKGGSRLEKDGMSIISDNLKMYQNLVSNRYRYDKLINLGSGAELFARNTPYGFSKHLIRESVLNTNGFYNIRIFGVFDENELDTRFIKSNIIRYINNQDMIIHKNKLMDFFHMGDLVSLIDYYISASNPQKEVNCSYQDKYSLVDIANMINSFSTHTVNVQVQEDGEENPYVGDFNLPISTYSFRNRMYVVYQKLLKEKYG